MSFWDFIGASIDVLSAVFVVIVGVFALVVLSMFIADRRQTRDAVRRNYPVLGRFRYLFTELGEFFRQYFFAMDREEMPFNRAQRNWIARTKDGQSESVAFGSTRNLTIPGTAIFVNAPFPPLERDYAHTAPLIIGKDCPKPFEAKSFFNISGMSFGALSKPAVLALSKGAKEAGCWYNTGEGGLSDWHLEGGCDIVFQIGTAKYGVRDENGGMSDEKLAEVAAHEQVRMFEIKLSQGAKPGKGGILPAEKVTETIARIRSIPVGQASISPNRHPEISSVSELLDFIKRVRDVTGKPTGFKTVIGDISWLRDMCDEIEKRGVESAPDFITIDSGDGGTGAAPMPLIDLMGLPVRQTLPMVVDLLRERDLKKRIRVIAGGKLVNPSDVAWALATGADFVTSARGFMFSLGCIQALKCNKNTCPTGITTHKPHLQKGLVPQEKYKNVANYAKVMVKDVEMIAHSCGVHCARSLQREHVRIVGDDGFAETRSLEKMWPTNAGEELLAQERA